MGLTATRKQFPPSRHAAAFDARTWRERVASQSWSARALKALRGAGDRAAASFRSWLPVLKDCDRAVRDRLAAVSGRCAPSVAKAIDGCAVAVERIALGARELSYRTSFEPGVDACRHRRGAAGGVLPMLRPGAVVRRRGPVGRRALGGHRRRASIARVAHGNIEHTGGTSGIGWPRPSRRDGSVNGGRDPRALGGTRRG